MPSRHYINLTNGIDAISEIDGPYVFCRIQSTTIERHDWVSLFTVDVCADMLMHLALGWECVLHDRGTNRPFSKTIYHSVPLIKYVLERRWYGREPAVALIGGRRGGTQNAAKYFEKVYNTLMNSRDGARVKRRLDYFKRYCVGDSVNLVGACRSTDRDGDYAYWREIAVEALGVTA